MTGSDDQFRHPTPTPSTQYPIPSTQHPTPKSQHPIPNTRVAKPLVWLTASGPAVWLLVCFGRGDLGHDPVKTITWTTGLTALILVLATLTITPLRQATGWNHLIRLRRLVGLWAWWYALMHFLAWAVFDRELSPAGMWEDIAERKWITVGFTAFTLLTVLAATSPRGIVRWLGGKRWQAIHRLVYVAAALGVLHFLWLVKLDVREPVWYALALVILLLARTGWGSRLLRARAGRIRNRRDLVDTAG